VIVRTLSSEFGVVLAFPRKWVRVSVMTDTCGDQGMQVLRPVCPNCQLPMQYQTSKLDQTHGHLRHVMFVCSCGLTSQVIAELSQASRNRP
jgi:hypothetical protein